MAKELTENEINSLNNLEKNMQDRLSEYKKLKQTQDKEELKKELQRLNDYLKGCRNSKIDDTLTNIRLCEEKAIVLEEILSK